jgi:hypothetical protein
MATKRVTVGTTKVTLVERNEARSALLICNAHSTAIIYVSDEGDVSTESFPIFPKTTMLLSFNEGIEVEKKILVISDTATTYVHIWECFKRVKEIPEEKPDVQEPGAKDPSM